MRSNPPDVSGRERLGRWLCERHNEVNERLGGQWEGRGGSGRSAVTPAAVAVAVAAARAAAEFEVVEEDAFAFGVCAFFFEGSQYRNAVQILHGFPSGPRTIPGGRGLLALFPLVVVAPSFEDEGCPELMLTVGASRGLSE